MAATASHPVTSTFVWRSEGNLGHHPQEGHSSPLRGSGSGLSLTRDRLVLASLYYAWHFYMVSGDGTRVFILVKQAFVSHFPSPEITA